LDLLRLSQALFIELLQYLVVLQLNSSFSRVGTRHLSQILLDPTDPVRKLAKSLF
jgi:hypothetical protein